MQPTLGKDATLREVYRVIQRRRKILLIISGIIFLLAILVAFLSARRYTATCIIQMEKSSSSGLNLDSLMGSAATDGPDSLTMNLDLQTQAQILRSDAIQLKVIRELNLLQTPDFQPHKTALSIILRIFRPPHPKEPMNIPLEETRYRRAAALQVFSQNLDVRVIPGTRLLQVSYTNPDPHIAAEVANHIVQGLIDFTFQTRYKATSEISQWLEVQLGDLRSQSENLQSKVVALQKETGLFGAGGADPQGRANVYSPVIDSLQQATTELSAARLNRVLKGAVNQVVHSGNPELISQLSGTGTAMGASQGVMNSLELIQSLRTQEASLKQQIAEDSHLYGPAYPRLVQERASLAAADRSLQDEETRLADRAQNDYNVAQKEERGAQAAYDEQRRAATTLNDKTIAYNLMQKEATQSEDLYQDLLRRLKEAGILEGLHSSNITVVDPAHAPAKPSVPNRKAYLASGLAFALIAGIVGAFLREAFDNTILGFEELEVTGVPLLGVLPQIKDLSLEPRVVVAHDPRSQFAENLRGVRSSLLLSRSKRPPQVILVTSSTPGEGKTTVSLNLAALLAQQGKRVVVIDADLRRGSVAKKLQITSPNGGLSELLSSGNEPAPIPISIQNGLYVLPAGPTPPFPAELIGSSRMAEIIDWLRSPFDFILLDSPPLLPVTDARLLVQLSDATLMVVRANKTSRSSLVHACNVWKQSAVSPSNHLLGIILNDLTSRSPSYYGYYGNEYSAYYTGEVS